MLTKVHNFIQASELRKNLSKYLKASKKEALVISTERGGEVRVLLDSTLYNRLVEAYEDEMDADELERLAKKDNGKRISLKVLKAKHGL